MSDENWAESIPDDAPCDTCGHRFEEHSDPESDEHGTDVCQRICTCAYFVRPYPPDRSNQPTSRQEAEQP